MARHQGGSCVTTALRVPEGMLECVREFVQAEGIALNVISEGDCAVEVFESECGERPESDLTTLRSGGWIACATAWAVAARLDISTRQMGALVNFLDIKIKACSLGCFK